MRIVPLFFAIGRVLYLRRIAQQCQWAAATALLIASVGVNSLIVTRLQSRLYRPRSKGVAECMVQRLSQMTRSPRRHLCE